MAEPKPQSFRVIDGGAATAVPDETPTQDVGAFLREARENTGRSLADVAVFLNIRSKFLKSIEDGRYEDLPGPTYAVGFVRSYAGYLGLDVEALVAQFKTESRGGERRLDLEFPVPSTVGWFPTGKVVAVCALLSAIVFSGWFYLQNKDSIDVAVVPAPPGFVSTIGVKADRQKSVDAPTTSAAAPVDASAADQPIVASMPAAVAEADLPLETPEPATADESEEPYQLPVPIAALVLPDPVATEADLQQVASPAAVVETPLAAAAAAAAPAAPPPVDPDPVALDVSELTPSSAGNSAPPPATKPRAAVAPPAAPAPAPQVATLPRIPAISRAAAESDGGRTYGVVNQKARVIIGARADSWVQVLDGNQNVVLTRMLRAGDRYLVPDRQDLIMLTGNAGGLIISVDGVTVPKIGSDGAILHNVRLDVELLKAGRAVIQ